MAPAQQAVQRRSRAPLIAALAALVALVAKRAYPKAALVWLFKRLLGKALGLVLPVRIPVAEAGRGSIGRIAKCIQGRGGKKPLIVTDEMLVKHGLLQKCLDSLSAAGLKYEVFDKVVANPPSELIEQGFKMYSDGGCDSIIAFGGGSPMDTAKVIGAKVCNPMPIKSYEGFFNATMGGFKSLPPFVAVPTTAGTGSETTVAAVITIAAEKRKIVIADLGLVPHVAVLDPELLEKLPKHITAATGLDALTHAIESFLSGWSTGFTRSMSLEAVGAIFAKLTTSYENGSDLQAREEMLTASYKAGLAFTRANVGYVHAIAHQLGGLFHTPHGDANAMLMPYVLDFYLKDEETPGPCTAMYCELAVTAGIASCCPSDADKKKELAKQLVARIREMNAACNIPTHVPDMKRSDVATVASRALKEAHGSGKNPLSSPIAWAFDLGYPTPKYMTQAECEDIVRNILPAAERA